MNNYIEMAKQNGCNIISRRSDEVIIEKNGNYYTLDESGYATYDMEKTLKNGAQNNFCNLL